MSNEYPYASMRDSFDLSAYFVVGPEDCKGRPLTDVVDQALHGGATFIQLRAKEADASELTDMARDIAQIIEDNEKSDSVAFVIDDRADVVWQARRKGIKVDGVHIGQTDMEPREARALLGDEAIVGLSAETESLVRLINELPDGCIDYIGAGPLHVSTTKPEEASSPKSGKSGFFLSTIFIVTVSRPMSSRFDNMRPGRSHGTCCKMSTCGVAMTSIVARAFPVCVTSRANP